MINREEIIRKYVNRQLNDAEKAAFDQLLNEDEQFAKDVTWASKLSAARDVSFEQGLDAYKRQRLLRWGKYGALTAIALLIVVGLFFGKTIYESLFPSTEPVKTFISPAIVNDDSLKIQFNQEGTNKIDLKSQEDSLKKLQRDPSVYPPKNEQKIPKKEVLPKKPAGLQVNQLYQLPSETVKLPRLDSFNSVNSQLTGTTPNVLTKNELHTSDSVYFQAEGFAHFQTFVTQVRNTNKYLGATKDDWRTLLFSQRKYVAALTAIRQERKTVSDEISLNTLYLFGGILNASIPEGNRQEAVVWLNAVIENGDYTDFAAEYLIKTYIELGEMEKAQTLLLKFPDLKEKLPNYLQKRL
jgi:hypothetical protein